MSQFYLIDIDGCISPGKNKNIDLTALKGLVDSLSDNYSLCTGRSAAYVECVAQFLSLDSWCICENGAYLFHTKTNELIIDNLVSENYLSLLADAKKLILNMYGGDQIKFEFGKEYSLSINSLNGGISKLYESILSILSSEVFNVDYSVTAVDITPARVNKSRGVANLKKIVYSDKRFSHMIGVGDSPNDISFLQACDSSACPNNSFEIVKSMSEYISPFKDTKGVIDIIKKYDSLY